MYMQFRATLNFNLKGNYMVQKYFTLNRSSWVQDFKNSCHLVKLHLEF